MTTIHEQSNSLRKETGECIFVSFKRHMIAVTSKVTENYSQGRKFSVDVQDVDSVSKNTDDSSYEKLVLFTSRFRDIPDSQLTDRDKIILLDRLCQLFFLRGAYYENGSYYYKDKVFYNKESLIQYLFPKVHFNSSVVNKGTTSLTLETLKNRVEAFSYLSNARTACILDNLALVVDCEETYKNMTSFLPDFAVSGYIDELGGSIEWFITDPEQFVNIRTPEGNLRLIKHLADARIKAVLTSDAKPSKGGTTDTTVYPIAKLMNGEFAFKYEY